MASSIQGLVPCACSGLRSRRSFPSSVFFVSVFPGSGPKMVRKGKFCGVCRAMVQQAAVQGDSSTYANDMERLSAKESLLLAGKRSFIIQQNLNPRNPLKGIRIGMEELDKFKDSGGFEALMTGKTTDLQCIDVNERIIGLERLNPTPRPTTSSFLEGRWNFDWFGSGSPGLFAARFIFKSFPSTLANLSKMDVVIKDRHAKITAITRLLNSIESKFVVSTQLSVEGPQRMKEEYVEGVLELPKVDEESIPEQLRGAFGQAVSTVQQLPVSIRDAITSGLKLPLSGTFRRQFMISYLDEEILIIRDGSGLPEVLTRLDTPQYLLAESPSEYES